MNRSDSVLEDFKRQLDEVEAEIEDDMPELDPDSDLHWGNLELTEYDSEDEV